MTYAQRLRKLADSTGLDAFGDEIRSIADEMDAQPADVADEQIDTVIRRHWGDSAIPTESVRQFARAILALRHERVPMSMGKAVMYGTHLYAGIMKGEAREVKNSVLIEFSSRQDCGAFLRWHDGITAQAKKEGA